MLCQTCLRLFYVYGRLHFKYVLKKEVEQFSLICKIQKIIKFLKSVHSLGWKSKISIGLYF